MQPFGDKTLGAVVFARGSFWTITSGIKASDLANLLHYTRSNKRDMSTGKKGTRLDEVRPKEEPRHWMVEETEVHELGFGEAAHEEPQQRRDREGMLERDF